MDDAVHTGSDEETTAGTDPAPEVHSPIAPRFTKETARGVKRHLDFSHYRAEVTRKKLVRCVLCVYVDCHRESLMVCVHLHGWNQLWICGCTNQSRPISMSEDQLQRLDAFLFHHVKATVVPRFLCLSKTDLRSCISAFVPAKVGGLPPDTTQQQVNHISAALIDDYYKYGCCAV